MGRQKKPPESPFPSPPRQRKSPGAIFRRRKKRKVNAAQFSGAADPDRPAQGSPPSSSMPKSQESDGALFAAERQEQGLSRTGETRLPIASDRDIVAARQKGRELALQLSFTSGDATLIAATISELARNIILYAQQGEIILGVAENGDRRGISVAARDEGPGIPDVERALQRGYSTSRSLGLGLPGVRRLMDEFHIASQVGQGTTVTVKKWK